MDSILNTIKKMLGIDPDYDAFDTDIIILINSVLLSLNQMGIGTSSPFSITGSEETWSDFLEGSTDLEPVKSYIYMKVRCAFDPPESSSAMEAMKNLMDEFEWRAHLQRE